MNRVSDLLPLPRPLVLAEDRLVILDQTALPLAERYLELYTPEEVFAAIQKLQVRGAPAIGIAAAYGLYLGLLPLAAGQQLVPATAVMDKAEYLASYLRSARPTAVNLAWALERVLTALREGLTAGLDARELIQVARRTATALLEEDNAICSAIGRQGLELIRRAAAERAVPRATSSQATGRPEADAADATGQEIGILTHCNAGGLATAGWGTALAVIYMAHAAGLPIHVYADETRPVLQGARLTAWELQRTGVPVTLICDNMAGALMAKGKVDLCIVGTDRVTANGDVANKIGTYTVAVLARHHGIPFYVAAPTSSIDMKLPRGEAIPIEERSPEEVTTIGGHRIAPVDVDVWNPAFDVTPAELVSALVTEHAILYPPYAEALKSLSNR
jgi:methylthioribose-1-phosphate isomerase